jgi:hypothetical protein
MVPHLLNKFSVIYWTGSIITIVRTKQCIFQKFYKLNFYYTHIRIPSAPKFYLRICFSLHIAKLSTQETSSRTVECSVKLMSTHHEEWKTKWLFSRKLLGTLLKDYQLRGYFLQVIGYASRRALAWFSLTRKTGKGMYVLQNTYAPALCIWQIRNNF